MLPKVSLSFCGCGFLGVYHLGVVSCLLKHGHLLLRRVDRVAGASAGALGAAVMVTCPTLQHVQAAKDLVFSVAKTIRSKPLGAFTPGYHFTQDMENLLDNFLPPDAHELAEGKLFVSLTNIRFRRNEVVCHFDSRQDLIKILAASCHIPVYSGTKFPTLNGQPYCDGGLSNNLVCFKDGRTITVSPFSGHQDIGPLDPVRVGSKPYFITARNHNIQVNLGNAERFRQALFPPSLLILQQYFENGQKEADRFLLREGLSDTNTSADS